MNNTPAAPIPAKPSLDELFATCADNLKHDDVTHAPFTSARIEPVIGVESPLDEATRAKFSQFAAHAPKQFLRTTV